MTTRAEKVASVLHRELGRLISGIELPHLTTIREIEVTPDLHFAKVWLSVLPDTEETQAEILGLLQDQLYDWQGVLNRQLGMKIVPRISFALDHSGQYVSHISDLIKKTREE